MPRSSLAVAWRTVAGGVLLVLGVLQLLLLLADFSPLDLVLGLAWAGLGIALLASRSRSGS